MLQPSSTVYIYIAQVRWRQCGVEPGVGGGEGYLRPGFFLEYAVLMIMMKKERKVRMLMELIKKMLQLGTAAFKAYCAILLRRSNFRYQASPRVSPRESTQRPKVELWARNVR